MSNSLSTIRTNLGIEVRDTSDNRWSEAEKNRAINAAIADAYPNWFTETTSSDGGSNWIVICTDKLEYTLPTMRRLLGVSLETCDEYYSGTVTTINADGGMTDSTASWTTDEWIVSDAYPYHVVIYDGYGKGAYAVITTNTSTTLSVTTTGYNWTFESLITPTETTYYMIKNRTDKIRDWRPIHAFRTDKVDNPTKLYLTTQYLEGMYLKLHYLAAPSLLSSDSDETDIDMQWIIYQAAAHLHRFRMQEAPNWEDDVNVNLFTLYQNLADQWKAQHYMTRPASSIRTEREHAYKVLPDEYPFA